MGFLGSTLDSKTRLKDGRTKRRELISGRESRERGPDEVGEATESRGQARGPGRCQIRNTLMGKTKWFCSRRRRGEESGNTPDWNADTWPFINSLLWFCDSFSCSLTDGEWKRE